MNGSCSLRKRVTTCEFAGLLSSLYFYLYREACTENAFEALRFSSEGPPLPPSCRLTSDVSLLRKMSRTRRLTRNATDSSVS